MARKSKTDVPEGKTLVSTTSLNSLADNVAFIAKSVQALSGEGKLTEDALVTLIERNCDAPSTYRESRVSRKDITKVLKSLRTLDVFIQRKKP